MMIVDSHIHVWAPNSAERPWPPAGPGRYPPQDGETWGPDRALAEMDRCGVAGMVLVPPTWEGERNDVAIDAVIRHPGRFVIMGRIDTEDPRNADRVSELAAEPGMRGLRVLLSKGSALQRDGAAHWLWAAAEKSGLAISLVAMGQYGLIEDIAIRHPDLKISLDGSGFVPGAKDEAAIARLPEVLALARLGNIGVKLSAAPAYSTQPYPFVNLHETLHRMFDTFGPQRLFWGAEIQRLSCDYNQAITMFTEHLPWLKGENLDYVMGLAICDWLDWRPAL